MFSFKKLANKKISSANIQLNLGKSPPLYSISISPPKSPQKRRNTNKPFTSYDFNKANDEYYNSFYKQSHSNIPNLSLMTEIKLFTNKLKKKLFTNKLKKIPIDLDLGKSSSSHKNIRNSIGGNKTTEKKFNKPSTKKSTKKTKLK